jgi:predicted amidohydrolase YtcJ
MAGLGESAPDIEGGAIEKDENGRPTGVLRENAAHLVRGRVPQPSPAEVRRFIELASAKALSLGVTTVGSFDIHGPDFEDIVSAYRDFYASGKKRTRVTIQSGVDMKEAILDSLIEKKYSSGRVFYEEDDAGPFLTMQAIKFFMDGTLGGETAWMREPYHDKPETRGFPTLDVELFGRLAAKAGKNGFQVVTHCIGDAAADAAINAYARANGGGPNTMRHGIVHCQMTRREDIGRIGKAGLLVLAQPVFLADDLAVLESHVGRELAMTSYAWKSLEKAGAVMAYSTDAPVCTIDPIANLHWAVNRASPGDKKPEGRFNPAECVDIETAVDNYTAGSAYSSFGEKEFGRIKPGFWADLAFLDKDIFTLPREEIYTAKVFKTLVAGE